MAEDTECNGIIVGPPQNEWSPLRSVVRGLGEAIDRLTLPDHCFADQIDTEDAAPPIQDIEDVDLSGVCALDLESMTRVCTAPAEGFGMDVENADGLLPPATPFADQIDAEDAQIVPEGIDVENADLSGDFGVKAADNPAPENQSVLTDDGGALKVDCETGQITSSGQCLMN